MRLGIITGASGGRSPDGRVMTHPSLGRMYDELASRFPGTRICIPVLASPPETMTHPLAFPERDLDVLPPMTTTITAQRVLIQTRAMLRRFADQSDVLFMRVPFQLPMALRHLGRPKVVHVVGNSRAVVAASTDYKGLLKPLAQAFAWHAATSLENLIQEPDTSVATNGDEMWRSLHPPRGRVVVSSSLHESEFDDAVRPLNDPPRVLFLAFLRPEKGIFTLLDAFDRIRASRPLKLTLAGGKDRPGETEQRVLDRVARSPYASDITVTGAVEFGPGLFQLYRAHDLYVLPSLSEGTPRSLLEARAFGCPVVSTRVGGIPSSVDDGVDGLLVPPSDAVALAGAMSSVLSDPALRVRLIEAGAARARRHTLERFIDDLEAEVRSVSKVR